MKFIATASAILAASALSASSFAAEGDKAATWGYKVDDTTMVSPKEWAKHYPTCGGSRQSPIDLTDNKDEATSKNLRSLRFRGQCDFNLSQREVAFNGEVVNGSCQARANGVIYDMAQFHLHVPSEHTLNGEPLDGEIHFVHKNEDGSALLMVGVFMDVDPEGDTDPWLESLIDGIDDVTPKAPVNLNLTSYSAMIRTNINAGSLFNYPGSLTAPGCDEIVDWWVVEHPLKISPKDLTRLQDNQGEIHNTEAGENARPVQPLNPSKRSVRQFK